MAPWEAMAGNTGPVRPLHGTARPSVFRAAADDVADLAIASPPNGATFLVDPTLRADFQQLPLTTTGAGGRLEWTVNGRPLGSVIAGAALSWPLTRGDHVFVVRDTRGRSAESRISVR